MLFWIDQNYQLLLIVLLVLTLSYLIVIGIYFIINRSRYLNEMRQFQMLQNSNTQKLMHVEGIVLRKIPKTEMYNYYCTSVHGKCKGKKCFDYRIDEKGNEICPEHSLEFV